MTIDRSFYPDAKRAVALDRRMHHELGQSLRHICEASQGAIPFDADRLGYLTRSLCDGQAVMPPVFALYYELVDAIQVGRADEAQALFDHLASAAPAPIEMQVVALGGEDLGVESERYARMLNADQSVELGFQAPSNEVESTFRERLREGFDLLDCALPELAGEIRAIVRQVVIAGSDPTKHMQFDGGSHYQLWGALFLNGDYHKDSIAVAEVLAHESAHSLLFGFCTDEPLVENDELELYASPLRADLRPMDGIYHATFVSARMHWTMSGLVQSGALSPQLHDRAREAAKADRRNFDSGYSVVAEHGCLTTLGADLMSGARQYMDATR